MPQPRRDTPTCSAALFVTPREEDPQIVVPLADVFVEFPGHSAAEVEQLVTTPLERILYQIDGVEYVYSMSQADRAVVTVRFYVGQDRERSLVKLFAKLGEHGDRIAPGVAGWVMKPVEIDDVPVVTLAVEHREPGGDPHALRRVAEELVERLAVLPNVSRAAVIGGAPRVVRVEPTVERMAAYGVDPATVARAIGVSGAVLPAGVFTRDDETVAVEAGHAIGSARDLAEIVVGVYDGRPVRLADVAEISDGPDEITDYVRHGWGPARRFAEHEGAPGTLIAAGHGGEPEPQAAVDGAASQPAVTIAISKQRGSNAVRVAADVIARAEAMAREVLPADMELVITRNAGLTADEKVNELVEALAVALVIVVALLTVAMGWREAFVVAVAVPVVFGLTLVVNMLAGYTINRVTLFALILALGMLVDDPIVDVENIARHFEERKRATRGIVLDAVAEIRPPLISATLAVIVSFLPLFAITGMMGPYMSPMALGVPVAMAMSMLVAFTITPWLAYHVLGGKYRRGSAAGAGELAAGEVPSEGLYDHAAVQQTLLYRIFRPLMLPLIRSRTIGYGFLLLTALATVAAAGMGALRMVPLKMLPFDNKNELLLLVDMEEGTSLERTRAVVARLEAAVAAEPEVIDFTSHTGIAGPIDFNGLVRHYGLRSRPHEAEIRVNLVGKKHRRLQSHGLGLRMRDELERIGREAGALVRIVELPPGPPVLASIVAEVRGGPDASYAEILDAADLVAARMRREPAVVEVDTTREAPQRKLVFEVDQEKAALAGVSAADVAAVVRTALDGDRSRTLVVEGDRRSLGLGQPHHDPQRVPLPFDHQRPRAVAGGRGGAAGGDRPVHGVAGGPDDPSQEPRAARLRDRRVHEPPAGRVRRRHPGRPGCEGSRGRRRGAPRTRRRGCHLSPARQWHPLERAAGIRGQLRGRRGVEDHARRVSRLGHRLRSGAGDDLRDPCRPDRLVHDSTGGDAGDPADAPGRDARLLAARPVRRQHRGRPCRPGLLHGHRDDRDDRPGGDRDPRLDHPRRLHRAGDEARSLAHRRDPREPRRPPPADPADRGHGDALGARPDLRRPRLVADLRPGRLDPVHAVRDPDLLPTAAGLRPEKSPITGTSRSRFPVTSGRLSRAMPKGYSFYTVIVSECVAVEFAFDPDKSAANARKHGIDFVAAQLLWLDDMLIEVPARTVGEPRWLVVGRIADKHWSAVITRRGDTIRVISVRRSRPEEINLYETLT